MPNIKNNKLLLFTIPFLFISQFLAVLKIAKKHKIDLINAHWILPAGLVCALAAKTGGRPLALTTHGPDVFVLFDNFLSPLSRLVVRAADRITTTGRRAAALMAKKSSIGPDKIDIIPMGVDSGAFASSQKRKEAGAKLIKEKLGFKPAGPILLCVAALAAHKGINYLIEAMPQITARFPKAVLLLAGRGEEEAKFKKLSAALKMEKNIYFIGGVENSFSPSLASGLLNKKRRVEYLFYIHITSLEGEHGA